MIEYALFDLEDAMTSSLKSTSFSVEEKSFTRSYTRRKLHCGNMDFSVSSECVGEYAMPIVKPYDGELPLQLIPFNQSLSSEYHCCCVHFYIDDYLFERIWTAPDKYVPILQRFQCIIGPDFSQYRDLPYPVRLYNCYRNRLLTQYFQSKGIKVIPNVTWSLPDSYDYSFSGIPANSVIAINCSGVNRCSLSKYLWYKGYEEAISRLAPSFIIRYGSVMEGEKTEISRYFQNERIKMVRYGR
jgi:hypothetical protein